MHHESDLEERDADAVVAELEVTDQVAERRWHDHPAVVPVKAVGLFIASARKPSGDPVVAYYDRTAGTLRLAVYDVGAFDPPVTLDGGGGADVGWYPSIAVASIFMPAAGCGVEAYRLFGSGRHANV